MGCMAGLPAAACPPRHETRRHLLVFSLALLGRPSALCGRQGPSAVSSARLALLRSAVASALGKAISRVLLHSQYGTGTQG